MMVIFIPEKIYVLGEINGINRNTLRKRVRDSGWDQHEAATVKVLTRVESGLLSNLNRRLLTPEQEESARINGISIGTVRSRIRNLKWDVERAVTEPINTFQEAGRKGRRGKKGMGNVSNVEKKAARELKKQKNLEFIKLVDEINELGELCCADCKGKTSKASQECTCEAASKIRHLREMVAMHEGGAVEEPVKPVKLVKSIAKTEITVRAYENLKNRGYNDRFIAKSFKCTPRELIAWQKENGLSSETSEVVQVKAKPIAPVAPVVPKVPTVRTVTLEHHERIKAQHEETNSIAVTKLTEAAFKLQAAEREIASLRVWQADYMKLEIDYLNAESENRKLKSRLDKLEHQELLIHLLMKNAVINDHSRFEKMEVKQCY